MNKNVRTAKTKAPIRRLILAATPRTEKGSKMKAKGSKMKAKDLAPSSSPSRPRRRCVRHTATRTPATTCEALMTLLVGATAGTSSTQPAGPTMESECVHEMNPASCAICCGRTLVKVIGPVGDSPVVDAEYYTSCELCTDKIKPGDPIVLTDGGWVHHSCWTTP